MLEKHCPVGSGASADRCLSRFLLSAIALWGVKLSLRLAPHLPQHYGEPLSFVPAQREASWIGGQFQCNQARAVTPAPVGAALETLETWLTEAKGLSL